jgi:hypothetical protein
MPITPTINLQTSVNGQSFSCVPTGEVSANASWPVSVVVGGTSESAIDPAWAGALTTRTDDNTGTITITDPAHTITTGAKLDIYWADGSRYQVTVGTVSGVSVPIDLGAGDNLPVANTALTAMVPNSETTAITGNNAQWIFCQSLCTTASSRITFTQSDNTVIATYLIPSTYRAAVPWIATSVSDVTNPFAGVTVGKVFMSCGDSDPPTTGWSITSNVGYE